jgi:hypothetical protein
MPPIAARDLYSDADLLPCRGVLEPLERLGGPASARPAREERCERRTSRKIGVCVQTDVCAPTRLVNHGEQLGRASLVLGEVEGRVREVDRTARLFGEAQHLGVRLDRLGTVAPVVRGVVGARILGEDAAECTELAGARVHPGGVGQAARHAHGAVGHCCLEQCDLRLDLPGRGNLVVRPHRQEAEVALRHEHGDVRCCAVAVQRVKVLGDGAPLEHPHALEGG